MQTVNDLLQEAPVEESRSAGKPAAREFDILDVLLIIVPRWRFILLTSIGGFVLAYLLVLLVAPSFTAKAVILPPQQDQSSSNAMMGQLGALASMTGMGSSLGLKNPVDLYIGMLGSNSVIDAMIKRFDVIRLTHPKHFSDAQKLMVGKSKFTAEKDGMISISVTDKNPRLAADMANAYVQELYALNNRIAVGPSSQRRLFFDQQLAQEKDRLADAEVALKETEEKTGVIAPSGQTENVIRQVAQIEAEITSREVQLQALRTSSTDQNPDVIRLNSELSGLRSELRDLESGQGKHAPGDIFISAANVPQVGLEYIRKERDVKYHQFLFDLLARQYEAARIDEAKAAPLIQVVDPAAVPDKKSAPYRAMWALVGGVLGFLFSFGYVIVSHIYRRLATDEEQGPRIALLRQELRFRR